MSPFGTILVAVDGRSGGRDALRLAERLAGPETDLVLGHVHVATWARGEAYAAAAAGLAADLLEAERDHAEVDALLRPWGDVSVARGLHRLAEDVGADLLVVGSCHRSALGRAFLGDVAREAATGAPCAVAVAPRGYVARGHAGPLQSVGVGWDGGEAADHALDVARSLAGDRAPIRLLRTALRTGLEAARTATSRLAGVESEVVAGHASRELSRLSREVDVLCVGSRASAPPSRLELGSTAAALAADAACPVLVVPRPA